MVLQSTTPVKKTFIRQPNLGLSKTPAMAPQTQSGPPIIAATAAHQQPLQPPPPPYAYPTHPQAPGGYLPVPLAPQIGGNYHQPYASFGPYTTPNMGHEIRQYTVYNEFQSYPIQLLTPPPPPGS